MLSRNSVNEKKMGKKKEVMRGEGIVKERMTEEDEIGFEKKEADRKKEREGE